MNALEIANLIFLLIQTGELNPEAEIILHRDFTEEHRISADKLTIFIRK